MMRFSLFFLSLFLVSISLNIQAQEQMALVIKSGHQSEIMSAFVSPDHKFLISVEREEVAILWDAESGKQLKSFNQIIAADFAQDSKSLEVVTADYQFQRISFSGEIIKKYGSPQKGLNKSNRINFAWESKSGVLLVDYNLHKRDAGLLAAVNGFPRTYAERIDAVFTADTRLGQINVYIKPYQVVNSTIPVTVEKNKDIEVIRVSADGKLLGLSSGRNTFQLVDIQQKQLVSSLKDNAIYNFVFSSTGKQVAVAAPGFVSLYSLPELKLLWKRSLPKLTKFTYTHNGVINFSAEGNQILVGAGQYMATLNATSGDLQTEFEGTVANWLDRQILSADNQRLWIKSGRKELLNWNLVSGKMEKPVAVENLARLFELSKDGKSIFTLKEKSYLEELGFDSKLKGTFESPEVRNHETTLSKSFDDKYIAYAGDDYYCSSCENRFMAKLEVFDAKTRKRLILKNNFSHVAFARTQNRFAAVNTLGKSSSLSFFDMPSGNLAFQVEIPGSVYGSSQLKFSEKDKYFSIYAASAIYLIDLQTKKIITIDRKLLGSANLTSSIFTPKENYFVMGTSSGEILFYDIAANSLDPRLTIKAHTNAVYGIDLTYDGKFLFSSSNEYLVKLWDLKNTKLVATLYPNPKTSDWAVITPEGRFDASINAQEYMYFLKGLDVYPLSILYEQFYTPRLLPRILVGELFPPIEVDLNSIKSAPKVKISYAELVRNLNVVEDKNPVFTNNSGRAEITVNAIVENDVIDEVRLFHNGKIVNLATRGLLVTDNNTGQTVKKYTINLLPGKNNFRAVALNSQRTESRPDDIQVNYVPANNSLVNSPAEDKRKDNIVDQIDRNATMHLLVVGINSYKNPKMSLNYALADATAFKIELEKRAKSVVKQLKTYLVTDDKADHDGILEAFKQVEQNAKPEDVFVFYYAGHGVISEKNKEFYLVPTNVSNLQQVDEELLKSGIPSKLLQNFAVNIQAQKQVFILDACQSAGAFEKLMVNDAKQEKSLAMVARSTGTHWLAASGSQQFAQEFSQLGHGAFTYVLLKALQGEAISNKMITINGMKDFLQIKFPELMKKYNGSQQFPVSYGYGKDFPVQIMP